jgi:hypothetical protein
MEVPEVPNEILISACKYCTMSTSFSTTYTRKCMLLENIGYTNISDEVNSIAEFAHILQCL